MRRCSVWTPERVKQDSSGREHREGLPDRGVIVCHQHQEDVSAGQVNAAGEIKLNP
jgi:hypothetical protein